MVFILRKNASEDEIKAIKKRLIKRQKTVGVDTKKFCGTIKLKEDPTEIQRRLRNEWR